MSCSPWPGAGYGVAGHPGAEKVCLVIDEADLCSRLIYLLQSAGYEVLAFANGEEALRAVRRTPIDLAVVDVDILGLNGPPALEMLRQRSDGLLLLTSASPAQIGGILELEWGGDDYVVKPFSLRELVNRIKAILRRLERQQSSPRESPLSPKAGV